MKSPATLAVAVLALVAATGLGALSYAQYRELIRLRTAASYYDPKSIADLEARLAELQKQKRDLEAALAARDRAEDPMGDETDAALLAAGPEAPPAAGEGNNRGDRGRGRDNDMRERFQQLLKNPEFAQAMALQQKAGLDARYASLFAKLNLPPAQLEQLKSLMVERQNAWMDVAMAAREQGVGGRDARDAMRDLMRETQSEIDGQIAALLGDQNYSTYQSYNENQSEYNLASQLNDRLSYSSGALKLNDFQEQQLVSLLASGESGTIGGGRGGGMMAFGMGGGSSNGPTARITDDTITKAQSFLAPSQVEALRQLQAEQQAQLTLMRTMREQMRGGGGGGNNRGGGGN